MTEIDLKWILQYFWRDYGDSENHLWRFGEYPEKQVPYHITKHDPQVEDQQVPLILNWGFIKLMVVIIASSIFIGFSIKWNAYLKIIVKM